MRSAETRSTEFELVLGGLAVIGMELSVIARSLLLSLIRIYQRYVSPLLPAACRFYPTCSEYAVQSIQTYGILRGGWFALRRVCRCHPFHPGGLDPVPPRSTREHLPPQE